MPRVYFITHPDVVKDATVRVPRWPLSERGLARMRAVLQQPWVSGLAAVWCSDETKALDGAGVLAAYLGLAPTILPELGEVDRSATGYLPEAEHAAAARRLLEFPHESVRGWETAAHAQARIVRAMGQVLAAAARYSEEEHCDVAVVSHGGVGTLLLCHLKGVPISMDEAQPGPNGGYYFCFETVTRTLLSGWKPIDP